MIQVPINRLQQHSTFRKSSTKCMLIKHLLKPPKPHYNILKTMTTCNYSPMLSSEIDEMDSYFEFVYPIEFESFCLENDLKPPKIQSGNGKALSAMLQFPNKYWDRKACDAFVKKYEIPTKDSIQLFNKHSQWGIKTNSDEHVKGKLYIVQPFSQSNKHKMRKSFKFDGTQQEKESEIAKIKSTIQEDYIHIYLMTNGNSDTRTLGRQTTRRTISSFNPQSKRNTKMTTYSLIPSPRCPCPTNSNECFKKKSSLSPKTKSKSIWSCLWSLKRIVMKPLRLMSRPMSEPMSEPRLMSRLPTMKIYKNWNIWILNFLFLRIHLHWLVSVIVWVSFMLLLFAFIADMNDCTLFLDGHFRPNWLNNFINTTFQKQAG